jgi:hypothetical protein
MKNLLAFAVMAAAVLSAPTVAHAGDTVSDRNAAIQLCRTEVTARAADADSVRFDQVRVRAAVVRVDFDVWRNGQLQNVRCDVTRGASLEIASITPELQAVASAR